jgi:hypothetical protein
MTLTLLINIHSKIKNITSLSVRTPAYHALTCQVSCLTASFCSWTFVHFRNNSRLALNNDVSHFDKKSVCIGLCYTYIYSPSALHATYCATTSVSECLYPMNVVQISCMGGVSVIVTTRWLSWRISPIFFFFLLAGNVLNWYGALMQNWLRC